GAEVGIERQGVNATGVLGFLGGKAGEGGAQVGVITGSFHQWGDVFQQTGSGALTNNEAVEEIDIRTFTTAHGSDQGSGVGLIRRGRWALDNLYGVTGIQSIVGFT